MACESCVDDHGAPGCGLLEGDDNAPAVLAALKNLPDEPPGWPADIEHRRADGSLSAAWSQTVWLDWLQQALYCAGDIKPGDTIMIKVVA